MKHTINGAIETARVNKEWHTHAYLCKLKDETLEIKRKFQEAMKVKSWAKVEINELMGDDK